MDFRNHDAALLERKLARFFDPSTTLAKQMLSTLGIERSLDIIRRARKQSPDEEQRRNYIRACFENERRVLELEAKLERIPDPFDVLAPEEITEEGPEACWEQFLERERIQEDIWLIKGCGVNFETFKARVGPHNMGPLYAKLAKAFGYDFSKMWRAIEAACNPRIRYPLRYLEVVIRAEKQVRREDSEQRR